MKTHVVAVDTSDSTLVGAAELLQQAIDESTMDRDVVSIQVLPMVAPYSLPDPDSYRDFHYTDRGFIVVVCYRLAE